MTPAVKPTKRDYRAFQNASNRFAKAATKIAVAVQNRIVCTEFTDVDVMLVFAIGKNERDALRHAIAAIDSAQGVQREEFKP